MSFKRIPVRINPTKLAIMLCSAHLLGCNIRSNPTSSDTLAGTDNPTNQLSVRLAIDGLPSDLQLISRLVYVSENCRESSFTDGVFKRVPVTKHRIVKIPRGATSESNYLLKAPVRFSERRYANLSLCNYRLTLSSAIDPTSGVLVGSSGSIYFLTDKEVERITNEPKMVASNGLRLESSDKTQRQPQPLHCTVDLTKFRPICVDQTIKIGPDYRAGVELKIGPRT